MKREAISGLLTKIVNIKLQDKYNTASEPIKCKSISNIPS